MILQLLKSRLFQCASVLYTGVLLWTMFFINISHASQEELSGVKSEISRQKKNLTTQQKELNALQKSLEKEELAISALTTSIQKTKLSLKKANSNLTNFEAEKATLEQQKHQQTETLKQLISTFYATKQHGMNAQKLWTGDDMSQSQRLSFYYQHLAKHRAKAIEALETTTAQLEAKNQQLLNEQQQVQSLLSQQQQKVTDLKTSQTKRKSTLAKIRKRITGDKSYLAELQRNETRLKAEIAKAAKRNKIPMDGIGKKKGRLPWPIKGKVLQSYGSNQSGQINLKGIIIDAKYEQPIKAVYSGTVVFAEYLRGYGLVVLLDHGKGDMTLYGYNQVLTKQEGDKVSTGEVIALAGDTGGQSRPSLYFEVRRNSRTQNPTRWLVR